MKTKEKIIGILKKRFRFEHRNEIEMFLDVDKATEDILNLFSQQKQEMVEGVETILQEIIRGEGAFSRDPLTHAENTIKNMTELAKKAVGIITSNKN